MNAKNTSHEWRWSTKLSHTRVVDSALRCNMRQARLLGLWGQLLNDLTRRAPRLSRLINNFHLSLSSRICFIMARLKSPAGLPELVKATFAKALSEGELNYYPTRVALLRANSIPVSLPASF